MFYDQAADTVIRELNTDKSLGLGTAEAEKRFKKYGPNSLPEKPGESVLAKFLSQFKNLLVLILIGATFLSLYLGDFLDAAAIFAIVVINAATGFFQEFKAEKTLKSLSSKDINFTLVIRNGIIEKIPSVEIVKGDIIILEEGVLIPADARIIESFSLHVNESILTGETVPASKNALRVPSGTPLTARTAMIFKETQVTSGRGKAVVTATGTETEIGKIALFLEIETAPEKTPLNLELDNIGARLTAVIACIAAAVFIIYTFRGIPVVVGLLTSVSLAVAAIPEGLPAIVTVVLSLGVARLAAKKTIVKKLASVETLGSVNIIATDKTGTLTENKINAVRLITPDNKEFTLTGDGYESKGFISDPENNTVDPENSPPLMSLLMCGIIANNAVVKTETGAPNTVIGDTTEGALLVAGLRAGINISEIQAGLTKVSEIPFSSERKMMSTIVRIGNSDKFIMYSKGAPEVIAGNCTFPADEKNRILKKAEVFASEGLRSLALAEKKLTHEEIRLVLEGKNVPEKGLTYLGTVLMRDRLRPEVIGALASSRRAGIRTVMITGDHRETARAIALEAGIMEPEDKVMTEDRINDLTDSGLRSLLKKNRVNVFARISPMGKLRIIKSLKSLPGAVVAVTGDGVNDAPALKTSHVGIAMGKTGTDIVRDVADIVVTDDNYATIIDAISEGRVIFANLVKFVRYLISCNLSEVLVIALAVTADIPSPLLPIQILWINLITDGLPALALGADPPEKDVMKRPPRDISLGILHRKRWLYMISEGGIMGASVFILFVYALTTFSLRHAQTMAFSALAIAQLVHAFNNRSTRKSVFSMGFLTNRYLLYTAIFSIALQVLVVQSYWGNKVFKTVALQPIHWFFIILVSLIPFFTVELKKQLRFRILP